MESDLDAHADSNAVLIGVGHYTDEAFPDVPAAVNSLHAMDDLLTDFELCGWPKERVTVLEDYRDPVEVALTLRRVAETTTGTLLVYFVGHGVVTEDGEVCLATGDTQFLHPDLTGLEYTKVRRILLSSPAQVKLMILDCCHSGRVITALSSSGENQLADLTDVRGVYTLTAADQFAHVPPLAEQSSACTSFTGALRDVVRQGIPGGPPNLGLGQMYSELRRVLRQRGLPQPNQRNTDTVDHYSFARNAAYRPPREGPASFQLIPPDRIDLFAKTAAEQPVHRLTQSAVDALPDHAGVYRLYFDAEPTGPQLLYVGMADRSISDRIRHHRQKINGRRNIAVDDVSFNYLLVDDMPYVNVGRLLASRLHDQGVNTPWNDNGFGNKDPGRQRDKTRLRSDQFDAMYPIDLAWLVQEARESVEMSAFSFAAMLKAELPYVFRFASGEVDIEPLRRTSIVVPEGLLSADQAFRLLSGAIGGDWQISALLGYVVMYREHKQDYLSATRYYVAGDVREAAPESYDYH